LKRLERQRDRGDRAENKVLEFEQTRLIELKRPDLAKQVYRISVDDVAAGYDIASFNINSSARYIEVKSSIGSQIAFQWSEGEREKAHVEKGRYFIYFVPFSFSLPALSSPIIILRDPIALINSGRLIEEPCGYRVTSREMLSK